MKNNEDVTQSVAELIRLHDDLLARLFALQALLQDLALISADDVRRRTEQFRKQFTMDLNARMGTREKKADLKRKSGITARAPAGMDSQTASLLSNPHHGHIVLPYSDDRQLIEAVGFYASSGLVREEAVILIVTEAHRRAIAGYLKTNFNVPALTASGQLSFLDAGELLSVFMVDGYPDPKLFQAGVKTVVERARRDERLGRNRKMRLFGEMVSLLWPANSTAAERLEELCSELIDEYSIPILCAYSVNGPGCGQLPESLMKAHSHSIPGSR